MSFLQNSKGDRYNLSILEQEWDSLQVGLKVFSFLNTRILFKLSKWCIIRVGVFVCLPQKMSYNRVDQLRELQSIIEEISKAIMWVNEKEEEELVFDWGDKNIDQYIPMKEESYSVRLNSVFLHQSIPVGDYILNSRLHMLTLKCPLMLCCPDRE